MKNFLCGVELNENIKGKVLDVNPVEFEAENHEEAIIKYLDKIEKTLFVLNIHDEKIWKVYSIDCTDANEIEKIMAYGGWRSEDEVEQ